MTSRRRLAALAGAALTILATTALAPGGAGPVMTPAHAAEPPGVLFGAYAMPRSDETMIEAVQRLEANLGRKLPMVRNYVMLGKRMDNPFHRFILGGERELFVSFKSRRESGENIPWKRIIAAKPSWTLYEEIVTMADSARALGVPIVMAFHHEPEARKNEIFGSSADFVGAWRKVVTIFRQRGATNVRWAWTMTSWAFEVPADDRRAAEKWYPGDAWVDLLGADPYNWNHCRDDVRDGWKSLEASITGFMRFAERHPDKLLALPEFGSDEGGPGQKAAWIAEASELLKRPGYAGRFALVSYFHNDDEISPACDWWLDSSPEAMRAAATMLADSHFQQNPTLSG